jgi:2-polyprenyl-6-methoxyphenol hydroxylase-like FAD-dependent oxidoreductase
MRIAIVGGGPSGLYFARLAKRADRGLDVHVFEQNPPNATFGFGVGLGGRSMREIEATDPDVHAALAARMMFNNAQNIRLNGEDVLLEYAHTSGSIPRLELLAVLHDACLEVGVEIAHEARIESSAQLAGYDLIVGADGVNSALRRERAEALESDLRHLTNHFAWYGVARAMRPDALVFRDVPEGRFIAHYYAYSKTMSTFVAECDDETWGRAGFGEMSDAERLSRVERIFSSELDGSPLVENRSVWRQFPVVTNRRWYDGNVVLVGDALRSAHFSIGSGTRLAMEDAAALAAALSEAGSDVQRLLDLYVALRKPRRDAFGEAAERSFNWYEDVARRMTQSPIDFTYDFLTRTGRIDDGRLETYVPGFSEIYRSRRAAVTA